MKMTTAQTLKYMKYAMNIMTAMNRSANTMALRVEPMALAKLADRAAPTTHRMLDRTWYTPSIARPANIGIPTAT